MAPAKPHARQLVLDDFDADDERRRETLLGLGNGYWSVRASTPEGPLCIVPERLSGDAVRDATLPPPASYPASYLAGVYSRLERVVDGRDVAIESLVRLPSPFILRLFGSADDADAADPQSIAPTLPGLLRYRIRLDFDSGLLHREYEMEDAQGRRTLVTDIRLVSMDCCALAASRTTVEPLNWHGQIEFRVPLAMPLTQGNVPRNLDYGYRYFDVCTDQQTTPGDAHAAHLVQSLITHAPPLHIALATRLACAAPDSLAALISSVTDGEEARWLTVKSAAAPGRAAVLEKTIVIATECHDEDSAQVADGTARQSAVADHALDQAKTAAPFAALCADHARAWEALWQRACIHTDEQRLARVLDLHCFHILQTLSPHAAQRDLGFPARGWQEAYYGQIFWDDVFVMPYLNLRFPELARTLLRYRHTRLPAARRAAAAHGYRGAMFPWRSAHSGEETTPPLQVNPLAGHAMADDTRLQRHIGAAICFNVWEYWLATGDQAMLEGWGAELIFEVARFWASAARFTPATGRYHLAGMIGPDEYHNAYPQSTEAGLLDNSYTNVMAVWTLCHALELLQRLPASVSAHWRRQLAIDDAELALWDDVSRRMTVVFFEDGVIGQFAGFDQLQRFDVAGFVHAHPDGRIDWTLDAQGDSANAYQLNKQADVLMLWHLLDTDTLRELFERLGYHFDEGAAGRTLDYYLARTAHESSLSRLVCASALARHDVEASWSFFVQSMGTDVVRAHSQGAGEGLHLGAMAGTLGLLQGCYLGLQCTETTLLLRPALPAALPPLSMRLQCRFGGLLLELGHDRRIGLHADADNTQAIPVATRNGAWQLAPGDKLHIDG
ncbi:MAG: glycoside hydrolase family 65 protein [Janthinobacterium lividum]